MAAGQGFTIDPIKSINRQKLSFEQQEAKLRAQAAQVLARDFPDFVANATDEDFDAAVNEAVGPLRESLEAPVTSPSDPLVPGEALVPGRGVRAGLSGVLDVLPERPQSTPQALGLGALESLAGGEKVRLDDAGQLVQLGATVAAGAVPLARAGPIANQLGKAVLASGAAAGVTGGVNQVLENAQKLLDGEQGLSRREAFIESLDKTSGTSILTRALGEAVLETTVGAGTAVAPTAAKAAFAKAAGVSDEVANRMVELAARHNINLSVQDVTKSRVLANAKDTLGRIPPFKKPFVAAAERQGREIDRAINDSLFSIAPGIKTIAEAAPDERSLKILRANAKFTNRVEGATTKFRDDANRLYDGFRKLARENGAQVGNANTVFRAAQARKKIRGLPLERTTTRGGREVLEAPRLSGISKRLDQELTRLIEMEPLPDLEAFIRRGAEIEQVIADLPDGAKEAKSILIEMKRAMEDDMHTNLVAPQEVIEALDAADSFFREGMELFSGQAARKFRRVDRSFGKVSAPKVTPDTNLPNSGVVSQNKAIETLLNTDDPGVIKNLHEIMLRGDREAGQKAFKEAVGIRLEQISEGARTQAINGGEFPVINTKDFRKALGLNNRSSSRFIANEEMFKRAGVDLNEFGDLMTQAEKFFENGVPDVSSFVTRRAMLGGLGSAVRSLSPLQVRRGANQTGVDFTKDVARGFAAFLMIRGGSEKITNPLVLKNLRALLDPKKNARFRLQAAKRILAVDSSFLVFDELTGNAISEFQNTLSLGPEEAAAAAERFNRAGGVGGAVRGGLDVFRGRPQ